VTHNGPLGAQALLLYFESRFPYLFLAVYLLLEHLPAAKLGQTNPGALATLPTLAKYFPPCRPADPKGGLKGGLKGVQKAAQAAERAVAGRDYSA
jgi:hypothetical protein